MKKYFLLIVLSFITLESFKTKQPNTSLPDSAKNDTKYILTIDESKISKPIDTVVFWGKKQYRYVAVRVKLTNLTNDRLVYTDFSCSTFEIFTTTNENVEVELQPCTKNMPMTFVVEPHQSSVTNLGLLSQKKSIGNKYSFAVGMYLCTPTDSCTIETLSDRKHWAKNQIIWSNEITIPK
jgi:hypothetical protein